MLERIRFFRTNSYDRRSPPNLEIGACNATSFLGELPPDGRFAAEMNLRAPQRG